MFLGIVFSMPPALRTVRRVGYRKGPKNLKAVRKDPNPKAREARKGSPVWSFVVKKPGIKTWLPDTLELDAE